MKKIIIALFLLLNTSLIIKADEGMWIPLLLKQLNESDMKENGLRLSAEDIYSINKSCLKDGIVQFNGGCTAEVISEKGLILTNHHCGFSQIQSHSTVENDLLKKGFWAMNQSEELINPGATAMFVIRMEDVTSKVLGTISDTLNDAEREKQINVNILALQQEAVKGSTYEAFIRPFYYGNEYYLFITETFKDVRLVGAPPSSIGKFGGDIDNYSWPRQTGDFSIFRIYANKDNKPAEYATDNVPYHPKYVIPITLKGIEENDFAMVYGFPARTKEYLTSYAVDMIMNQSDPDIVKIRAARLSIMDAQMKTNDLIHLQYIDKYSRLSNYYKKWTGEIRGLKKLDAVNKKQAFEKEFLTKANMLPETAKKYGNVINDLEKKYIAIKPLNKQRDYYVEALLGIEAISYSLTFKETLELINNNGDTAVIHKNIDKLKKNASVFFKNYDPNTDKKVAVALLKLYYNDIEKINQPDIFKEIEKKYNGDFDKYVDHIFNKSLFVSLDKVNEVLSNLQKKHKKIEKDPIYKIMLSCNKKYITDVSPTYTKLDNEITKLSKIYMRGMREVLTVKKYYPDANSTLRLSYGKVLGYTPRDAVKYNYYTTIEGVMEKEDSLSDEFIVPQKLKALYLKKDYGQYADKNGELRIAFIATLHTTGGNSGSPVLNADGQLVGTNFDRNWEGTMSDVMYDPDRVRNISVDIRYTLFIVDKFAGAGYLLNEMNIIK
ncbi:MAG: S46 family peptidase [Bacteroidia bacterium]